MILEYILEEKSEGKTINKILEQEFQLSSRLFSKLIRNKRVSINGQIIDTRLSAKPGDKLAIDLNYPEDNSNIVSKKMDLNIIYEDDGLLILDKPAGIAVHPSIRHYKDSLANGVKYYFETNGIHKKIRPVNRLDLNTSGLIIFAKNEYMQENLIKQMENRTFTKEYLAIVEGNLEKNNGIIDAPIARKEESIIERCVSESGQKAVTEYEVIQKNDNFSIVKCKLLTGRTHQIRVHMAYIGHPLLGDTLYGSTFSEVYRQALHSYKIKFRHPITKKIIEFKSDLPKDLLSMIKSISNTTNK